MNLLSLLKKIGNVLLMGGGAAFAIAPIWASTPYSFVPFLLGHFCWIAAGKIESDKDLIYLNVFLAFLDITAILMRFNPSWDLSKIFFG